MFADVITVKERSKKRSKFLQSKDPGNKSGVTVEAEENSDGDEYFEDAPPFDESISFNEMNISRPLLKVSLTM